MGNKILKFIEEEDKRYARSDYTLVSFKREFVGIPIVDVIESLGLMKEKNITHIDFYSEDDSCGDREAITIEAIIFRDETQEEMESRTNKEKQKREEKEKINIQIKKANEKREREEYKRLHSKYGK